jgi:2-polyprenyl-3-methyl-5-hydroxy-6-metoxy-1,4-benzoquinol methylase
VNNIYEDKPRDYYEIVRHDIFPFIPTGIQSLLDVGCGCGATAAELKKLFDIKEVVGVEYFAEMGLHAEKKLDKVIVGDIEYLSLPYPTEYFDCILCADVLEHTRDPWSVLRKLGTHLSHDGYLVASIPNLRHIVPLLKIICDKFEYQTSGILDKSHLRFFTLHTMKELFESAGFTISRVGTNRSRSWKFMLLNVCSLGVLRPFSIYQYIIVAKKI